jgi:prepilin-type N-terminal cleavage/methylation domain-containing protein
MPAPFLFRSGNMDTTPSSQQTGFTLLELVAVLLLLGILSTSLFLRWSPGASTLNAQADQLARTLRHAQSLSLAQGRSLRFAVQSATAYAITDGAATITDPQGVVQSYTLSNSVTLAGNDLDFDSLGRPIDAANSLIASAQSWTLSAAGATATVSVSPLTGFVTVTP